MSKNNLLFLFYLNTVTYMLKRYCISNRFKVTIDVFDQLNMNSVNIIDLFVI